MNDIWKERWDERYRQDEFAYGELPNNYLREQLSKLELGFILFPAEGEGRNAVFAAQLGWAVSAFDISMEGKIKAIKLAEKNQVTIDYQIGELESLHFENEQFDVIALIYAHFPAAIKSHYHKSLNSYLKNGGIIILKRLAKNTLIMSLQTKK